MQNAFARDAALAERAAQDALQAEALTSQFSGLEARLTARAAAVDIDRSLAILKYEEQQISLASLFAQLKDTAHALWNADSKWQEKAMAVDTAITGLQIRTETRPVVQALVDTIVDRQRQSQTNAVEVAIDDLHANLNAIASNDRHREGRLEQRLSLAEEATATASNDWSVAIQAATAALCPHKSPLTQLLSLEHTTQSRSHVRTVFPPKAQNSK